VEQEFQLELSRMLVVLLFPRREGGLLLVGGRLAFGQRPLGFQALPIADQPAAQSGLLVRQPGPQDLLDPLRIELALVAQGLRQGRRGGHHLSHQGERVLGSVADAAQPIPPPLPVGRTGALTGEGVEVLHIAVDPGQLPSDAGVQPQGLEGMEQP